MAEPAQKIETAPESAPRPVSDEEGVILSPEQEEWFDEMSAEAEEDERAGRFITFDEMRARLRRTA